MVQHYRDCWALGKMEWLIATLTLLKECGQTKVTKAKDPKGVLTLKQYLLKSIQSRKDYYN
jgi:hypothetical protein